MKKNNRKNSDIVHVVNQFNEHDVTDLFDN